MDSAQDHPKPGDEGLVRVLWQTWWEIPPRTRRTVMVTLGMVLLAIVLQIGDRFSNSAPVQLVARLIALIAGTGGAILLSIAYTLHSASQNLASCSLTAFRPAQMGFESRVLHRLLLALPTLGMISGVLLSMVLGTVLMSSFGGRPVGLLVAAIYGGMLVLAGLTVTRTTRFLYRHAHEQAEAATRARAEASEAQLAALQARMNPHFLFNALNTVASLVRTDPKAAESTVENLAGVLRRTLDRSRHTWRTVGDEVDYLKAYLAVEQERWGDRLRVEWAIAPEMRPLPLPPMTLQPLVENALKHGLGTRLDSGALQISGALEDGTLRLAVVDDGVGFAPRYKEGTGLGNLRRRLATLYGDRARLDLQSNGSGSTVVIEIVGAESVVVREAGTSEPS